MTNVNKFSSILKVLGKSQLFVALCAFFLSAEAYIIAAVEPDYFVLGTVFFATLFVYNASRLNLSIDEHTETPKWIVTLNGNKSHVILCVISFIAVFTFLTKCNMHQVMMFQTGGILSLFYLMPFSKNGIKIKGLRNHLLFKNIILSLIWALATVLFPFAGKSILLQNHEILFIFLRHFFFIYALTIVFDMRDLQHDIKAGMNTLALTLGESGTKLFALLMIAVFVLLVAFDPGLNKIGMEPIAVALYLSAVISAIIISSVRKTKSKYYYAFVVDGAMIIQFVLVFLLSTLCS